MKQCLYTLLTVLSIIVITTISFSNTIEQPIKKALPLTKGNYWIYQGKIQWENQPTYENVLGECGEIADYYLYSTTLEERNFTWKLEVLESYEFGNIKVALLNNDFTNLSLENLNLGSSNLDSSNGNSPNRAFVLISIDDQKYYLITDEFAEKIIDRARNNNFNFTDLNILQEEDLILLLPLKANSHFGRSKENNVETQLNKAADNSNDCLAWCWRVNKVNKEQTTKFNPNNIVGLNISHPVNEYFLSWSFNNGIVSKEFVPTVGFSQYTSLYHGPSLYERISLDLIECKIN
ncbi:MAG: hypothetical protein WAQ98_02375 [Blastocatellia bacterium]